MPALDSALAPSPHAKPSFLKAASIVASVTLLSKGLGAVRDWAILRTYGAALATDAYFTAVQLPSFSLILLGGVGGPFHSAAVAVITKLIHAPDGTKDPDGEKKAHDLANVVITLTAIAFALLAVLTVILAEPITRALLQGSANEQLIATATAQLQTMAPVVFLGGIVGLALGLQNTYQHFFWPALSPAAQSLVMIGALFLLPADPSGQLLAWSTVIGSLLQLAMQLPQLWQHGHFKKLSLKIRQVWPELRQMNRLLLPALGTTALGQVSVLSDLVFAAMLPLGAWTAVVLANRLIQLPIGVMQTAFLVPVFPRFTQAVGAGKPEQVVRDYKLGVNALLLLSTPILVILVLYGQTLVRWVFQHGAFDADDTRVVSQALIWLSFLMPVYFARDAMTRVFYAFEDAHTPLYITIQGIALKAFFNWLLILELPKHFPAQMAYLGLNNVSGICLGSVLATAINLVALSWISRRFIKGLGVAALLDNLWRLTLAALAMIAAMLALKLLGDFWYWPDWATVITGTAVGCLLYAAAAWMLRVPEGQYLVARCLQRIRPSTG